MARLLLGAALLLGFGACQCLPSRTCVQQSDCVAGQVCLSTGECSDVCTADEQCGKAMRCSHGGSCIASGGCAVDQDCQGGTVCSAANSRCVPSCATSGCPGTQTCAASGHCVDGNVGGGQGGGGGSASGGGGGSGKDCGGQLFGTTPTEANILIAFDRSGSMNEAIGNRTKWSIATDAIKLLTAQHQGRIRFGLILFPGADVCTAGAVSVPVGAQKANDIAAALDRTSPNGRTPIAGVLYAAGGVGEMLDPSRANYVLLMTDGMETCYGGPLGETQSLFRKNIGTYVVGFGTGVDPAALTAMAVEGGTARSVLPRYFQADDAQSLNTAMSDIANAALACDFRLNQVPPDPTRVFVYINGVLAKRDPAGRDGWEYNAATQRITLYGPTCDQVTKQRAKVQVVYGCPDDRVVGGGSDGGAGNGGDPDDGGSRWPTGDGGAGGGPGGGSGDGGSDAGGEIN